VWVLRQNGYGPWITVYGSFALVAKFSLGDVLVVVILVRNERKTERIMYNSVCVQCVEKVKVKGVEAVRSRRL